MTELTRLCGRLKRNGEPCAAGALPGQQACRRHLTVEERHNVPAAKPRRRWTPTELEQMVKQAKPTRPQPKKATPEPLSGDDAMIVLAAMHLYADRVLGLVDRLSRDLG